jgi:hypothetical protein
VKANATKQKQAIDYLRRFLERERGTDQFRKNVTKFEVTPTDHGSIWVSAKLEYGDNVSENSVLRLLDREDWYVNVGPRGQLNVWMCPKSCEQFAGKRAFGMKFRREVRSTYKPRISK